MADACRIAASPAGRDRARGAGPVRPGILCAAVPGGQRLFPPTRAGQFLGAGTRQLAAGSQKFPQDSPGAEKGPARSGKPVYAGETVPANVRPVSGAPRPGQRHRIVHRSGCPLSGQFARRRCPVRCRGEFAGSCGQGGRSKGPPAHHHRGLPEGRPVPQGPGPAAGTGAICPGCPASCRRPGGPGCERTGPAFVDRDCGRTAANRPGRDRPGQILVLS